LHSGVPVASPAAKQFETMLVWSKEKTNGAKVNGKA